MDLQIVFRLCVPQGGHEVSEFLDDGDDLLLAAVDPVCRPLAGPRCQVVVAEPDVRNDAALRRLRREGFTFADEIDLPAKRAQLVILTRQRFETDAHVPGSDP